MRIALIVWEYPPHVVGGLGTYAGAMAPALRRAGHDVDVFAVIRQTTPPAGSGVRWIRPLDLSATYPHVFEGGATAWGAFFGELYSANVLWADAVRRAHEDEPYDVLAVHDWLSAPAGILLRTSLDVPQVFHVHSTERGRQASSPSPIVDHWEETLGHAADAVITVSHAMREDLARRGWPDSRLNAVWNGVDPKLYNPESPGGAAVRARYGIPAGAPLVLFIGRLTAVKGIMPLVLAWPEVVRVNPSARLVILGSGELEPDVRSTIASSGVGDSVTVRAEFVTEGERIAHYLACDLAVLPSTYEPFGIVGIEAMACGKPVVCGANGLVGLREQVVNEGPERSGVHVNGNDAGDIAWGITETLADRDRMRAWGANARRRVEAEFTWDHAAAQTAEVYAKVVKR